LGRAPGLSVRRLLRDLDLPGNLREALKGDRKDQYSIRVNDQWRIGFEWHKSLKESFMARNAVHPGEHFAEQLEALGLLEGLWRLAADAWRRRIWRGGQWNDWSGSPRRSRFSRPSLGWDLSRHAFELIKRREEPLLRRFRFADWH
jgi:hypothetical protein